MAIPAYMWLTNAEGAEIPGGVKVAGREGSIEILSAEHEIRIPTDIDTGAITATRKHGAFTFTKMVDPSSVYLYQACATGQSLKQVNIKWYQIADLGREQEYYRHVLEDVKVMSVKHMMYDVKLKEHEQHPHLEQVELRYASITWHYIAGNIRHRDSWVQGR